jgi:hypothetical protein
MANNLPFEKKVAVVSRGQLMRLSYRALQIIALAFGSARRCRRNVWEYDNL